MTAQKSSLFSFILTLLFIFSMNAQASKPNSATALVDSEWLSNHLDDENLLMIDLRSKDFFEYANIPGSVHSDYNQWRQTDRQGTRKMLPSQQQLEKLLSALGATENTHIVLIHSGQTASDLASAARVYWTLEQINHQQKSILAGGIIDYANHRYPLRRGPAKAKPASYHISAMKINQPDANSIHKNTDWNRIDVRSSAEFQGIYQERGEKPGTLPGSASLPYDWMTIDGSGQLHSKENLQTLINSTGLNPDKNSVYFCHTGHRASLSWFVASEVLGDKKAHLYDGSTLEWAVRDDLPVEQKLNIKLN